MGYNGLHIGSAESAIPHNPYRLLGKGRFMTVFPVRRSNQRRFTGPTKTGVIAGILLVAGAAMLVGSLPYFADKAEEVFLFGLSGVAVGLVMYCFAIINGRLNRIEEYERRQVEALHEFLDLVDPRRRQS